MFTSALQFIIYAFSIYGLEAVNCPDLFSLNLNQKIYKQAK